MTLCVAWKDKFNIHFASDSRIINGDKYSDYGIKVIPIPVKVFSPTEHTTGIATVAFEKTYGMCFAGSFTGAYVIREFLIVILQRLQYIPGWIDISFDNICKLIYKYYSHLLKNIHNELDYDHSVDFFISGYCPANKRIKLAKFFIDYGENIDSYNPKYHTYEEGPIKEAIGTGNELFEFKFEKLESIADFNIRILNAMKQAIEANAVQSVGGSVQYGRFDNNFDFSTYGIADYVLEEGKYLKIKHCIAGINMNGDEFDPKDSELHFMGEFIDPFKPSIS